MKYTSSLIKKQEIASETMAFYFEKPAGFVFKAGQSIDLSLVNPPETDDEGNTRPFSIAAAPSEDHLMIATRMRDTAFKRVLKGSKEGLPLSFEGPFGSFALHKDETRPAVALIGGIGITPIRSILKEAAHLKLTHRIFLFYSNRRPEDAAFFEELKDLETKNRNFKFIPTMTQADKSVKPWTGETGYITKEMIEKYIPKGDKPIYYITGPLAMVTAMRSVLEDAAVSEDDIRTEEFTGY